MTLGSLFDGSGTCPLAAAMCGITPVWASEIEPYPIRVTQKNFPQMKHLGDITQINGAEIEPVDIVTFGSPCQDLSVAGTQKGLIDGKRSSLFFEAIRIIMEMREATHAARTRMRNARSTSPRRRMASRRIGGGKRVFCNPPYGRELPKWIKKAHDEAEKGALVVMLIPARTDTRAFHDYIYHQAEIRFLRGRIRFVGSKWGAPFPSMVVIFEGKTNRGR